MQVSPFNRAISTLLAVLFSLAALAALVFVTIDQVLLAPSVYKSALSDRQLYSRLPAIVAGQLVLDLNGNVCADNPLRCAQAAPHVLDCFRTSLGPTRFSALASGIEAPSDQEAARIRTCIQQNQPDLGSAIDSAGGLQSLFRSVRPSDLEMVLAPLLPPAVLQAAADNYLDQFFSYLNNSQESISIDLTGLKASLSGPAGVQVLLGLLQLQPPCTAEQIIQITATILSGKGELTLCSPPAELLDLVSPFLQSLQATTVSLLPDRWVSAPLGVQSLPNYGPFGTGLRGSIRLARTLALLSPLLPLFFLLILTLWRVRSFKDLLTWWGLPFLVTGLLALVLGLAGSALFEPLWLALLRGHIPLNLSVEVMGGMHDLFQSILQTFCRDLDLSGGLLAAVGLAMRIGSELI